MKRRAKGIKKPRGERIKKALVVFNPEAGLAVLRMGDKKIIERYLKRKLIQYTFYTTKEDKPIELEKYKEEKFDIIIVAGGDGTVREVAHWMLKNNDKTPLAIIPSGTSNFYAMGLGVPLTLRRALSFAIKHKAMPQDVGIVNKKQYFLFVAGAGYSAKFAQDTPRRLKKVIGFPSYLLIAVAHSFNKDYIEGTLQTDGDTREIRTRALVAFNMRSALNVNPYVPLDAHPGVLDVLIADEIKVTNVMRLAKRFTDEKRTLDQNQVKLIKTKKLIFESKSVIPMEIDGETWTGKKLEIELIPNALNIVCGKSSPK
ncbi:YegS/Rv2252/BmrU family lipid kinase [Patescibacteria group bacterium]|nr:YegS/Rv2252/BmrU family lipid kinase [Patescibacteria group bacterium]MBU1674009.1 YegS/Rv2252/BmrU family lipid kinase [Patescibacteria group bacterium]MBU1963163.1 YegS/Rv2252/BmrU family lipid kinase [Patescibacteria group bacterium]